MTHLKATLSAIYLVAFCLFGTGPAMAMTHYVDATLKSDCADGNYNSDSRTCNGSEGSAYNTLQEAVDASQPGDTILVRGARWSEKNITITDKSRTANLTIKAYAGEKPVIDNNTTDGSPGDWAKIIFIDNTEGVTIDGLELREWSCGMYVRNSPNCTIRNMVIAEMYQKNFVAMNSPYTILEDSEFYHGAIRRYLWHKTSDSKHKGPWPAMVTFIFGNKNSIIRRNIIRDSYWEGCDVGRSTENVLIEYNEIYGNNELQLYVINNLNCTIRYNLIYGTERSDYEPKPGLRPGGYGWGIWLSMEDNPECDPSYYEGKHKVYGNLVANTRVNFALETHKNSSGQFYPITGVEVYNNTFVGARKINILFHNKIGNGHIFKNNIIWANGEGNITNNVPSGRIDADYNLWSTEPNPNIKGPNDPPYGPPNLRKANGWDKLSSGVLKGSEFAINGISPGINRGTALDSNYKEILDVDQTNWKNKSYTLRDQTTSGDGWEIGGDVFLIDPPVLRIKSSPNG